MRQIQVIAPDENVVDLLFLLRQYDENAMHIKVTGHLDTIMVHVPDEKLDEVVEKLRATGIKEEGSIVILPSSVTMIRECEQEEKKSGIAPTLEILAQAQESSELTRSFFYMTVISAFVATLGLLLDSTAAVIGAMVIAPLLGPSISVCVGTVLGDGKLFKNSLLNIMLGLILAIGVSTITGLLIVRSGLIPPLLELNVSLPKEILERTNLNVLNIGLALASGAAGAYSFAEKRGETLMGVMIAVALIPPAGVTGIGIALGNMEIFGGALLILIVNVICINIAGTVVFWRMGLKPRDLFSEGTSGRKVKKRLATTAVILLVISSIFIFSTLQSYSEYQMKEDIQGEALAISLALMNVTDAEITSIEITGGSIIDMTGDSVDIDIILMSSIGGIQSDSANIIRDGLEASFGSEYEFNVKTTMESISLSF